MGCPKGRYAKLTSLFDCLMFDLDDTLYSPDTGITEAVKKNIEDFLVEKCGFARNHASNLRIELFRNYGSTLAGLRALGYNIRPDDYHSFVHGRLPYERIKPNPQLRSLLLSITQRKIIFTNSNETHALKVLSRLGLEDCFEQIICFETLNPNLSEANRPDEIPVLLKPSFAAMEIAIVAANVDPHRTLFLDDNVRNLAAGKAMALKTALLGKSRKNIEADYVMQTINNLAEAIPEIWMSNRLAKNHDEKGIRATTSDIEARNSSRTGISGYNPIFLSGRMGINMVKRPVTGQIWVKTIIPTRVTRSEMWFSKYTYPISVPARPFFACPIPIML